MTDEVRGGVCLVTGGAGFIGCALSAELADHYDRVVALDNLHPQVHATGERPAALDERVELVRGDVTSAADWDALLDDVHPTSVVHLAAETGTAQSLTEATRHAMVNVVGTTTMLDAFVRHDAVPGRVLLTSSRRCTARAPGRTRTAGSSTPASAAPRCCEAGQWDFPGLTATPFESSRVRPTPTSVYGSTKLARRTS